MKDEEITFVTSNTDNRLTSQQTRYSCKSTVTATVTAAARSISNNNLQG